MKDKFKQKSLDLTAELSAKSPNLLKSYSVELYLADMDSYRGYYPYYFISHRLNTIFGAIERDYTTEGLAQFHQLALCLFSLKTLDELESKKIPTNIGICYREWIDRVYRDFSSQSERYYHHSNSNFQKDLAVLSGRAIPVGGAWIVERALKNVTYLIARALKNGTYLIARAPLRNGLSSSVDHRSLSVRKQFSTLLGQIGLHKYLWYLVRRFTGSKRYYAIHTVDRFMPRVTPSQMEKAYLNIAELLGMDNQVQGIYRESWFLDPKLKDISPGLSFLWELPQQNGAHLFRKDCPDHVIKNALAMSPQRRKLFESGEYHPHRYAYAWPRNDVLDWAGSYRERSGIG